MQSQLHWSIKIDNLSLVLNTIKSETVHCIWEYFFTFPLKWFDNVEDFNLPENFSNFVGVCLQWEYIPFGNSGNTPSYFIQRDRSLAELGQ